MRALEVDDRRRMSLILILSALPKQLALRSKAKLRARKIHFKWAASIGSVGSSHDSEVGIAITNRQVPKSCKEVGTNSPLWPAAMPLPWLNKMCESRSLSGEV